MDILLKPNYPQGRVGGLDVGGVDDDDDDGMKAKNTSSSSRIV